MSMEKEKEAIDIMVSEKVQHEIIEFDAQQSDQNNQFLQSDDVEMAKPDGNGHGDVAVEIVPTIQEEKSQSQPSQPEESKHDDDLPETPTKKRLVYSVMEADSPDLNDTKIDMKPPAKLEKSAIVFQRNNASPRKRKSTVDITTHVNYNKKAGFLYVMGQGDVGQLGLGPDVQECVTPTFVETKSLKFVQVASGGLHMLCLSSEGVVYSCGCNDEGALGRPTTDDNDSILLKVQLPRSVRAKKISAGDSHSAALTMDGKVYAWGAFRDTNGPVGFKHIKEILRKPIQIFNIEDKCVDISSGTNHILILTESGRVFSCGTGDEGQLGRVPQHRALSRGGRRGSVQLTIPEEIHFRKPSRKSFQVVRIHAGRFNSFAFTSDGDLFGWGLNDYHQLGDRYQSRVYFPVLLQNIMEFCAQEHDATQLCIGAGIQHTIVLNSETNKVYSMGNSHDGRLGVEKPPPPPPSDESDDDSPTIFEVDLPANISKISQISCGEACSFILTEDSQIYSWGVGCNNQLGFKDDSDVLVPTLVPQIQMVDQIIQISSGAQHTAILCLK